MNAQQTNTLLHAYKGDKTNVGIFHVHLTDDSGNRLTDDGGNYLLGSVVGTFISSHAQPTNTLLHAED